jgi:hypothetical protein
MAPHVNAEIERRQDMGADVKRTRARTRAAEQAAQLELRKMRDAQPVRRAAHPVAGGGCVPPQRPQAAPPALEPLTFGQAGAEVRAALFATLRAMQTAPAAPAAACE